MGTASGLLFCSDDRCPAILLHEGSYETLPESHDALYGRWLPQSGREPADKPPFEKYLNDPSTTKPEDLRTEIYLPLCPS